MAPDIYEQQKQGKVQTNKQTILRIHYK